MSTLNVISNQIHKSTSCHGCSMYSHFYFYTFKEKEEEGRMEKISSFPLSLPPFPCSALFPSIVTFFIVTE